MARFIFDGEELSAEEFGEARAFGMKATDVTAMFDRAEALQNAAKALKGLKALDDDALETLYREAKGERRARHSKVLEPLLNKDNPWPHIEIGYRDAESIAEESEGELGLWDASQYEGWYWTEFGHNRDVVNGESDFESRDAALRNAQEYLASVDRELPFSIKQ
ncbi:hypothetical protein [Streptomyces sp. NPDC005385]|uniref:hypothetical protein n=1 Tax=Streptomyces sp. NPDC005385 TaxID=3157039 RepID=UPI0033B3A7E4